MKDILVHARDFESRTPAMLFGASLATAFEAAMSAVYVCPAPVYAAPAYHPELMTAILETSRQLRSEAIQARPGFLQWASAQGIARAQWLVAQGDTAAALAQASTRHDVLVLDREPAERDAPQWLSAPLIEAGVPCIVVPPHGPRFEQIERAALCWNGSPEAMRAIRAALPLLAGKQVLLLCGQERSRFPGVDWEPSFDIGAYLRQHGIEAEQRAVDAKDDEAGYVLLDEAASFQAQLLVMGAYGRSRFSEWILGGATRHVLARAGMPLLLHH